jgi:hypothetical protein
VLVEGAPHGVVAHADARRHVAIERTTRTWRRPPQIARVPRQVPLSWVSGATPTKGAICLTAPWPRSGRWASKVREMAGRGPGRLAQQLVARARPGWRAAADPAPYPAPPGPAPARRCAPRPWGAPPAAPAACDASRRSASLPPGAAARPGPRAPGAARRAADGAAGESPRRRGPGPPRPRRRSWPAVRWPWRSHAPDGD